MSLYKFANKMDRMLARKLRERQNINTAFSICEIEGSVTSNTNTMYTAFHSYYQALYSQDFDNPTRVTDQFLGTMNLPHLSPTLAETIQHPVTGEEIEYSVPHIRQ